MYHVVQDFLHSFPFKFSKDDLVFNNDFLVNLLLLLVLLRRGFDLACGLSGRRGNDFARAGVAQLSHRSRNWHLWSRHRGI